MVTCQEHRHVLYQLKPLSLNIISGFYLCYFWAYLTWLTQVVLSKFIELLIISRHHIFSQVFTVILQWTHTGISNYQCLNFHPPRLLDGCGCSNHGRIEKYPPNFHQTCIWRGVLRCRFSSKVEIVILLSFHTCLPLLCCFFLVKGEWGWIIN